MFILGGIYSGMFSPTESAGIACVYAMLVTRYVYREISWAQILEIATDSAFLTGQIMIIVAAASVFSWLLIINQVPQTLIAFYRWTASVAMDGIAGHQCLVAGCRLHH